MVTYYESLVVAIFLVRHILGGKLRYLVLLFPRMRKLKLSTTRIRLYSLHPGNETVA